MLACGVTAWAHDRINAVLVWQAASKAVGYTYKCLFSVWVRWLIVLLLIPCCR